jgi:GNAT superfamily N-acetyltransferase
MLRPSTPDDTPLLLTLTTETGYFKPHEIEALEEVLEDYHAVNHEYGHQAWTWEHEGACIGFVYFAPTAMTDRTWELWWIVVRKESQGQGIGGQMLARVEALAQEAEARILLIETSSTGIYTSTRQFYLKHGYAEVAHIPDFYADGDGKVIFSKRLAP